MALWGGGAVHGVGTGNTLTFWSTNHGFESREWLLFTLSISKQNSLAKCPFSLKLACMLWVEQTAVWIHVWRGGVVGSTLAFGSIGYGFESNIAYFRIIVHQPLASWDHWRSARWTIRFVACRSFQFPQLTILSGDCESRSNVLVAYCCGVNRAKQKKLDAGSSFPTRYIN